MVRITVLYENNPNPADAALEIGWGLSLLIEIDQKKVLFDTGWHGDILLRNCQKLKVKLNQIDCLVVSHPHWDHMGGLPQVLGHLKPSATIYFPDDYSTNQINEVKRLRPDFSLFVNKFFTILDQITPNLAITPAVPGEMNIKEQALVVKGADGSGALVVGCLHPGLERFIDSAKRYAPIKYIVGGLHGFKNWEFLKTSGINSFAIGHCTKFIADFQKESQFTTQLLYLGLQLNLN